MSRAKKALIATRGGQAIGSFRISVDATGAVTSVTAVKSTGYAAYDDKIVSEMRSWVFSPYLIDGKPRSVYTAITFVYRSQ